MPRTERPRYHHARPSEPGPVSAVSTGLPAAIRSFSPKWVRQLIALTPAPPDPLSARFITDLRTRGVRVPRDVAQQLAGGDRDIDAET
jgi:hypothetical protein